MERVINPFLPLNEYIPDVEPHVFNDRVYVYGSHDREGGTTFCELDYVVYSADVKDLTDWTYEGTIYSASQDPHSTEVVQGGGERKYLYAPDVVQGNDGRYYLYYCLAAHSGKGGFNGPISVAVCDTPAGKYEYYGDVKYPDGSLMLRFIPFDPAVINDEGKIYLYYGWALPVGPTNSKLVKGIYNKVMQGMLHRTMDEIKSEAQGIMGANVVELEADMLTVKSEPKRIIPCEMEAKNTDFEGHAFFEASSIRRIGSTYYFIYSSFVNHELCYATSIYPDKDFQYGGVIISNGDIGMNGRNPRDRLAITGNNHGSIECIDGNWYIFYHRHTHMSSNSRQVCAERINILNDGSIPQVEMTSCGLNGGPLEASGEYPAVIACNLTDGRMPHLTNGSSKKIKPHITHRADERFITNISNRTLIGYKYFNFQGTTRLTVKTRGQGSGTLIISDEPGKKRAAIKVDASDTWTLDSTLIDLKGTHALYFTYSGNKSIEFLSFSFEKSEG
ncbi:hypothetical protein BS614_20160 [Paenibacillus xylanexedens]|uniref:family 43 glycosylhydrolase n=1 Tax=Paenibacillus xylanexedens TaxID=528191 RepID=UPI000938257F|nr:family 43 glycosylhydrolase [Paenibacillus xylanexedens]APO46112.1 hypothetical protein BS614_20160 [Paenibacillus xylanexedens]